MTKENMKIGDTWYYARIMPVTNTYDVCDLRIHTMADSYFIGTDKRDKHAYLLSYDTLGTAVFPDRDTALRLVLQEQDSHTCRKSEKYYEEY